MKNNIIMEKTGVKNLKKILMRVHCLSREQALFILNYYDDKNPELTLNSLIQARVVFEVGSNGIAVSPKIEYNFARITCIWILIKFLDKIDVNNIYLAQQPSSIFFLMDNEMYEVALVDPGREATIAYALNHRTSMDSEINYIALLYDISQLDALYEENIKYPKLNIVYALIRGTDENGMLVINIMSRE